MLTRKLEFAIIIQTYNICTGFQETIDVQIESVLKRYSEYLKDNEALQDRKKLDRLFALKDLIL